MLGRSMEADVVLCYAGSDRKRKRLDPAIEVLIVDRIFVVPHARRGICHLICNVGNAVITRIGLDTDEGRSAPGVDRRLLPHSTANPLESEWACRIRNIDLAPRGIV